MLKLADNPPVLCPDDTFILETEGTWWVARTKSRNEKALAWNLNKWGIPYFLPLIEKTTSRSGRRFKSLVPLFSGYLFFRGDDQQRHQAFTTNRIAQTIDVRDQEKLIRELSAIHVAISSGMDMDTHPHVKEGKLCRVTAGPLIGAQGVVVSRKNISRILLDVEMLGQSAAVEISADLLEAVE